MADVPTYADSFDAGEREALILPTRFNPEIIRVEGSDVNVAVAIAAAMSEECSRAVQASFNETHLSTAADVGGEVLDRWVFDRYQLTRYEAQASVATLSLQRTDTSVAVTVESGSLFGTEGGIVFAIINDVVFPAGSAGPFYVQAVAEQTGPQGNVEAGSITEVVSSLEDTTIAVTNDETAAGGQNTETDSELAARARNFFINARRGTRQAVINGALDTPGVTQASAIEHLDPNTGLAIYRLQLVIADRDGTANAALGNRVVLNEEEYRCLGVPVSVVPGIPEFVLISVENMEFVAGANTSDVIDQVRGSIVGAVNGIAPNEKLRRATIIRAIESIPQTLLDDSDLVLPAGDLVPSEGGVIRTTKALVTINGV